VTRIDWGEVLTDLKREHASIAEGFTVAELRKLTGWADRWAYMCVRAWIDAGEVEHAGSKGGIAINGRTKKVPVYRMTAHRAGHGGRAIKGR
jgi:hypothetical protein